MGIEKDLKRLKAEKVDMTPPPLPKVSPDVIATHLKMYWSLPTTMEKLSFLKSLDNTTLHILSEADPKLVVDFAERMERK